MGYLNNQVVTIDAILTRKGRELLAKGDGSFNITQFALADDEIDYTLYNPNHPSGSNYYGEAIEEFEGFQAGAVTLQGQYGGIADKIFVHPNPKEALFGIDNGEIKNVTFRRRTPSDQSALLMLDAPSGSRGRLTPSGDGYLIPSDLTPTQKKNALSIINKLNAQNAFRKNN